MTIFFKCILLMSHFTILIDSLEKFYFEGLENKRRHSLKAFHNGFWISQLHCSWENLINMDISSLLKLIHIEESRRNMPCQVHFDIASFGLYNIRIRMILWYNGSCDLLHGFQHKINASIALWYRTSGSNRTTI